MPSTLGAQFSLIKCNAMSSQVGTEHGDGCLQYELTLALWDPAQDIVEATNERLTWARYERRSRSRSRSRARSPPSGRRRTRSPPRRSRSPPRRSRRSPSRVRSASPRTRRSPSPRRARQGTPLKGGERWAMGGGGERWEMT